MDKPNNIIVIGKDIEVRDGDYNALYVGGFDDIEPSRAELSDDEFRVLISIISRLRNI